MSAFKSILAVVLVFPGLVFAQSSLININPNRDVAIHGYDPVAYFTTSKATEGSTKYSHDHLGATWQFSNQQNLDLFIKNPEKYIPQYGGYCAHAASQESKADVDPIT